MKKEREGNTTVSFSKVKVERGQVTWAGMIGEFWDLRNPPIAESGVRIPVIPGSGMGRGQDIKIMGFTPSKGAA